MFGTDDNTTDNPSEDFIWLQQAEKNLTDEYIEKWGSKVIDEKIKFYSSTTTSKIFEQLPNLLSNDGYKLVSKK